MIHAFRNWSPSNVKLLPSKLDLKSLVESAGPDFCVILGNKPEILDQDNLSLSMVIIMIRRWNYGCLSWTLPFERTKTGTTVLLSCANKLNQMLMGETDPKWNIINIYNTKPKKLCKPQHSLHKKLRKEYLLKFASLCLKLLPPSSLSWQRDSMPTLLSTYWYQRRWTGGVLLGNTKKWRSSQYNQGLEKWYDCAAAIMRTDDQQAQLLWVLVLLRSYGWSLRCSHCLIRVGSVALFKTCVCCCFIERVEKLSKKTICHCRSADHWRRSVGRPLHGYVQLSL